MIAFYTCSFRENLATSTDIDLLRFLDRVKASGHGASGGGCHSEEELRRL